MKDANGYRLQGNRNETHLPHIDLGERRKIARSPMAGISVEVVADETGAASLDE
ncbi:hypothetical protein AB9E29_16365 [Rhizobium leguminosarum]|uniref:hypothetical protein n=1 Tax=Rhizobium leguminosarum TaxID=384 RepID=UPI0013DC959C|nr:hypothetical protein [Rhizobium leguminosarum]NEK33324.1 hypothetical protein [Rhizobium leguminosarum]